MEQNGPSEIIQWERNVGYWIWMGAILKGIGFPFGATKLNLNCGLCRELQVLLSNWKNNLCLAFATMVSSASFETRMNLFRLQNYVWQCLDTKTHNALPKWMVKALNYFANKMCQSQSHLLCITEAAIRVCLLSNWTNNLCLVFATIVFSASFGTRMNLFLLQNYVWKCWDTNHVMHCQN